ncbi:hypothetical protein G3I20_16745 [Streptomyces sp. SID8111]|uniref:EcsC family protein n=2 Tax=unclassified Streptomyces TaxID=2593676 RepID=A0A6G3TYT0_9ACTN|nr:hypothetical protein [Streptomyces sp. S12]NEA84973.1 hypothetical protein [Streptomyces sp. SID14436]NEC28166.1 hypothetical protein [Streptomyces sp. SID8111]NEC78950.1 hypothetical protein [Streptomyces sp. SID7958]NEC83811.1 hypothetical protein [Streptomyces sp. SID7958]
MTGSTPSRKRRLFARGADQGPQSGPQHDARDHERGPTGTGGASLEHAGHQGDLPAPEEVPAPVARRRAAAFRDRAREGARKGGARARAGLAYLADRIIEMAPRVPVRDLQTLRAQFPGLGPEELADKLVAGAANATATVGAGVGAAAAMPVPPAMPAELAAEVTGVAAIELKLIAELHEVYGVRPAGTLARRSTVYLNTWSEERGVEATKPSTVSAALNSRMKRELRQRIMKRTVRNLPNLMPFLVGAAVGAFMNRRDTRKLAARIRADLRRIQVPWDRLAPLPALETPADALDMDRLTEGPHRHRDGRGTEGDGPAA